SGSRARSPPRAVGSVPSAVVGAGGVFAAEQAWATHMLLGSWVRFGIGQVGTGILCGKTGGTHGDPAGERVGSGATYSAALFQEPQVGGRLSGGHVSCVYVH